MRSISPVPARRKSGKDDKSELTLLRDELTSVTDRLGELSAKLGKLTLPATSEVQTVKSPAAEATEFFRRRQHFHRLKLRLFGEDAFNALGWLVALELMLARLANTSLSEAELLDRLDHEPVQILDEIAALIRSQQIECFYDPAEPAIAQYCLSGETARRMIDFYRARKTA